MEGKTGYLKIAKDKITRKGDPFVALLIAQTPDAEGEWINLFDAMWFGGSENSSSEYDIRLYAHKDSPSKVLYQAAESNGYTTCTFIRPFDESWGEDMDKLPYKEQTKEKTKVDMPQGFRDIEEAFAHIRTGCDVLEAYLLGRITK
jgi:hypothetical protein